MAYIVDNTLILAAAPIAAALVQRNANKELSEDVLAVIVETALNAVSRGYDLYRSNNPIDPTGIL